jgi:hypothetical protein
MTLTDAEKDKASAADLKTALVFEELKTEALEAKLASAKNFIIRFIAAATLADTEGDWSHLDSLKVEARNF